MGLLAFFFPEKPEVPVPKDICYHIEIPGAQDHKTSPFIWEGCSGKPLRFIGGYDNYLHHCRKNHSTELNNKRV
ncbi:hypothetical protein BGW42_006023 [Actinomortierella wolfii]|nr:hypothetical protein BGW42_006023 [Actinomortierella wolfii]